MALAIVSEVVEWQSREILVDGDVGDSSGAMLLLSVRAVWGHRRIGF